jgi:hypothetical protein
LSWPSSPPPIDRVIITIKLELDALREHFLKVSALRRCWLQKEGGKKAGRYVMAQQVDCERLSDGDWEIKKGREHKRVRRAEALL